MKKHTVTEEDIRSIIKHLEPIALCQSIAPSAWKTLYLDPTPGLVDKYIVIQKTAIIIRTAFLGEAVKEYNEL